MALVIRLQHPPGTRDLPREEREKIAPLPVVVVSRASDRHHFSTRFVMQGVAQGWLSIRQARFHLHQPSGAPDVVYKIVRTPGEHVQEDGSKEVIHYFDCLREE